MALSRVPGADVVLTAVAVIDADCPPAIRVDVALNAEAVADIAMRGPWGAFAVRILRALDANPGCGADGPVDSDAIARRRARRLARVRLCRAAGTLAGTLVCRETLDALVVAVIANGAAARAIIVTRAARGRRRSVAPVRYGFAEQRDGMRIAGARRHRDCAEQEH
jgi:hypothetical protein